MPRFLCEHSQLNSGQSKPPDWGLTELALMGFQLQFLQWLLDVEQNQHWTGDICPSLLRSLVGGVPRSAPPSRLHFTTS